MKTFFQWLFRILVTMGIIAGLIFAFIEGREEMARERQREQPIETPPRTHRAPGGETLVRLDDETRQRVTIAVEKLTAAKHSPETKAYGQVMDPAPLLLMHGELVAAEAALTNSNAQFQRTKTLFEEDQNASRRAYDLVEAQQRTDAARLLNAQQRWLLATGDAAGQMNAAQREPFVHQLVKREVVLLRVEVPPGSPVIKPKGGRVLPQANDAPSVAIRTIHPAPTVDATLRGQAFLLVVDQPGPHLPPGTVVTTLLTLPGDVANGVTLPVSAVVRSAGLAWAYVQTGEHEFTRREVATNAAMPGGWFVTAGFTAGDAVVVTGAQTLLSEEFKSQISVGEEAEK